MSKRDVWGHDRIAAVRPDARYSLIDLIAVGNQQPALLQTMLAQIIALYAERKLVPLPCTAFPIDRAIDAFRYMQQARHVGKIVLIPPSAEEPVIRSGVPISLQAASVVWVWLSPNGWSARRTPSHVDRTQQA